ncbi:hypothetical protein [Ruminococcus sp.]|uniref:hypothetical protein n=1 Tax=Ruminococcus sp. TaxID=41978 RepID=UPI003F0F1E9B
MKSQPLFSAQEISILYDCLDIYANSEVFVIEPELTYKLIMSCLEKLENICPFTNFTKQEFTIMGLALNFCSDTCEKSSLPYGFDKLLGKLYTLAS